MYVHVYNTLVFDDLCRNVPIFTIPNKMARSTWRLAACVVFLLVWLVSIEVRNGILIILSGSLTILVVCIGFL